MTTLKITDGAALNEPFFGTDRDAFCMRFIGMETGRAVRSINAALYDGPWDLDPDAFPTPITLPATLRKFKCVRTKTESDYDGERTYRVRVYSVPKGTKHVRVALAMLAHCLDRVAPWDEREARRRAAIEKWNAKKRANGGLRLSGLEAWLPRSAP